MRWLNLVNRDPVPWLLDPVNASVRYLTLRDIFNKPAEDLISEQARILQSKTVSTILNQWIEINFWGRAYNPYYGGAAGNFGTLDLLRQMGAPVQPKIRQVCESVLEQGRGIDGAFSPEQGAQAPWLCYTGIGLQIMAHFGYAEDLRSLSAWDKLVQTVLNQPHILSCSLASGPCLDALVKALGALLSRAESRRDRDDQRAIDVLCDHILDYPFQAEINRPNWPYSQLRFPRHTDTDLLEVCHILAHTPARDDPRLLSLVNMIITYQNQEGRWPKMHNTPVLNTEGLGQPSRWLTYEAIHTLISLFGENPYAA